MTRSKNAAHYSSNMRYRMRNHKISTGKKIFVALVATIGFLTFSSPSLADSLNETINEKKTATQTWEIDAVNNPGDNQVTFTGAGSIEVTEATPDRVIAANV
ncbi:MAG: hypothetical protein LBQ23_01625, partial [Puniceicoccales bacterium]|nr:hypothetical protein [Puniceicoccales bacterium]